MSNVPAPSETAQRLVRPVLRGLSSARQIYALYPAGHPDRGQVVRELLDNIRALRETVSGEPTLFVTRHSFYLGPTLLARESLSLFRLVDAFERADVHALEFTAEVRERDIDALIRLVHGDLGLADRFGGILINRVHPLVTFEGASDLDLSDLRRAYAMGLEVLRETALRVAAGQTVDLDAATTVVEGLADQIATDPANALLLTTVKSYDEYTYYHMLNVGLLSIALGQAIGLRHDQVISLGLGGLLHDVGKVHMPEDVLFHVGKLSEEQWRIVQKHPVDGAGLIFGTQEGLYHPAATVVLEHHAAYDLSGYPSLSHRPHPSLPARLVSVADCFDAVTSKRAYRGPAERREALDVIEAGSGRGFDPRVVRVFVGLLGLFPVGSLVRLHTGEVGLVTENHPSLLARPTVLMVLDAHGNTVEPEERDLASVDREGQYRWNITRTVDPSEIGIDVMAFLTTGELQSPGDETPTGLVHEPSYGEAPPDGYVDTHNDEPHTHHLHLPDGGQLDPDVHPPI